MNGSSTRDRYCEKCGHRTYWWDAWTCSVCMNKNKESK